jgi:type IV secretion system protein VirB6
MADERVHIFTDLQTKMLEPILGFIDQAVANTSQAMAGPLKAGLVLYVMVFGWQLMSGQIQAPMMEIAKRGMKWGVILMLVLGASGGSYESWIKTPFLTTIPNEVASMVMSQTPDPAASSFDTIANTVGIVTTRMWGEASGWSPAEALGIAINIGLLNVFAFIALAVGFYYVTYAKLVLGLLLGLGPIFIACALFDSTRRFFDGWLSQCANFIILQILIAAVQAVIVKMLLGIFQGPFGVTHPGAFASAIVTCCVMTMVFWQLPNISHALAQGGASLGLQAIPGVGAAKRAIETRAGDKVAQWGSEARANGVSPNFRQRAASSLAAGSRGGMRDHRNYQGRGVASHRSSTASTDSVTDGASNLSQQQSSELK